MKRGVKSALRSGAALALMTPGVAHADVIIGPRVAYYFDNSNLRTSSIAGGIQNEDLLFDQERVAELEALFPGEVQAIGAQEGVGVLADQIAVPMVGATVNFGDDRDRFTITGLYGEGSGSFSQTQAVTRLLFFRGQQEAVDFGQQINDLQFDYERLDLEATWQRRTSENFAVLAGVRYERLERQGDGFSTQGITQNAQNALDQLIAFGRGEPPPPISPDSPAAFGFITESSTQQVFSARAGVTAFVPVNDSLTGFFNGMVHTSYQPEITSVTEFDDFDFNVTSATSSELSAGPDFAVGAQLILSDGVALDIRYRANIFFPLSGDQSFSDARVNHGVNLGLSLRL